MTAILLLALVSLCWAALPVVDLGYELYRANALNVGQLSSDGYKKNFQLIIQAGHSWAL